MGRAAPHPTQAAQGPIQPPPPGMGRHSFSHHSLTALWVKDFPLMSNVGEGQAAFRRNISPWVFSEGYVRDSAARSTSLSQFVKTYRGFKPLNQGSRKKAQVQEVHLRKCGSFIHELSLEWWCPEQWGAEALCSLCPILQSHWIAFWYTVKQHKLYWM